MSLFKECLICQKIIKCKPSHFTKIKTCSRACLAIYYKDALSGSNNPNFSDAGKKRCSLCDKKYYSYNKKSKFCSRLCAGINMRNDKSISQRKARRLRVLVWKPVEYKCLICKTVDVPRKVKFCSKCRSDRFIRKINCKYCGREYIYRRNKNRKPRYFCSRACCHAGRSGSQNSNWRGGRRTKNAIIRASKEYKEWRIRVFVRDNYSCIFCGQHGGTLHADHIKPFSLFPDLRLEDSNGRTLCVECHKKTDTYLKNYKKSDYGDSLNN